MTKPTLLQVFLCLLPLLSVANPKKDKLQKNISQLVTFTENKGQVRDQNGGHRSDVIFSGVTGDLLFHLRRDGLSYEFRKPLTTNTVSIKNYKTVEVVDRWSSARIDVSWPGVNKNTRVIKNNPTGGVTHYYTGGNKNGITNVRAYEGVTYQEIYPGIDLHFYSKGSTFKYDYILSPFSDPQKIRLKVSGHARLELTADGSLRIVTALGVVEEGKPIAFQDGKKIPASWKIVGSELIFVLGAYDRSRKLIIDPAVRVWGTYYGGSSGDMILSCTSDETGHTYVSGRSDASGTVIATTGSHQTTVTGAPAAFLARFNAAGFREWGTFYGDSYEEGTDCVSAGGVVYMVGRYAGTASLIATSGAHQNLSGGGEDGFLVKFDTLGIRQWGTFYGGAGTDQLYSVAADKQGNVYVAGTTNSTLGIATTGAFKNTLSGSKDAFLVKFNSAGVRQWASYYGDTQDELDPFCMTDTLGNVYLGGWFFPGTIGGTIIATAGAHQTAFYNTPNGTYSYLVKFDGSGQRQWGTYYGSGNDHFYTGTTDLAGNVFVGGMASLNAGTGTLVVSSGAYQPNNNGFADGHLVKFNTSGVRQWATYFGSTSWDYIYGCATDSAGNVFVGGTTSSSFAPLFITPNNHQSLYGGNAEDAFLGKFTGSGQLIWSTYYGGTGNDKGYAVATGPGNVVYLAGTTNSSGGQAIATLNAHQSVYGGSINDGFLVKFFDCTSPPVPVNVTPNINRLLCGNGGSTTLSVTATYPVSWFSSPSSTSVIGSGLSFSTSLLPLGTYTFYAETFGCSPSASRTAITVTVAATPTISAPSGSVCLGKQYVIQPVGALSYTYSSGTATVSPVINSSYSIVGTSSAGCVSANSVVVSVTVLNLPTVTVNSGQICPANVFSIQPQGASVYMITGGSFTVSPVQTTTYLVTGTSVDGCTATAVSTVSILPVPVLSVTSGSVCSGSGFTISASGAQSYNYLPAQIFSPTLSTQFTVLGTAINGCTSSIQGSVTVSALPLVTANSGSICAGQSFTIQPAGATSYSYSSTTPVVSPAITSTYSITGFDGNCWSESPAIVTVTVFSIPQISVNSGSICAGNSFVIIPSGAATYSITGPSFTVSPGQTTYYSISGTSSAGCTSTASVKSNITVFPLPIVTAVSDKSVICIGQAIGLLAQGALNYSWTNGPTTANYLLSPNATTVYTVTGLDANACQATATVQVTVNTCTDLSDLNNKNWSIYPNPTKEFVFIHSEIDQTIRIFDASGRFMLSAEVKGDLKLDISHFSSGIYFIEASGDTELTRVKLIKE